MGDKQHDKPKFVPDRRPKIGRDLKGEPPPWAIVVMIIVIGFVGLMFTLGRGGSGFIYDIIPFARSDWFWIGLIALPFVALIALAVLSKGLDLQRAKSWSQTTGRVVSSKLETRRHRFEGEAETVENVPAVEYEFNVGAVKYRGSRIGIGDDSGGANTEATLKRYAQGAAVTVFYDPNDPKNCVLERGGPFAAAAPADATATAGANAAQAATRPLTVQGCAIDLIKLAAIGGAIWWLIARGPDFIAAHFPKADPPVTIFAAGFGLVVLLFFFAMRRTMKQAQRWPVAKGKVMRSEVTSFQELSDGRHTTMYRPEVEYAYQVHGLDFRGAQIKLGATVSGTESYAQSVTAKYRVGDAVDVHYDPANPGTAALENPTGMSWILLAIAAGCFAVAASTLGVFR